MTSGGLLLAALALSVGVWLWRREQHWRHQWQVLSDDLGLDYDSVGETLSGVVGGARLTASLQSGRLRVSVALPAGRLGGLSVRRLSSGLLGIEAEDPAYAGVFLLQPGISSGLEALLVIPGDRLVGHHLLLERPGDQAEALPALVGELGLFLDAVRDARVAPRPPSPGDPFFVPSSAPRTQGPLEPTPRSPAEAAPQRVWVPGAATVQEAVEEEEAESGGEGDAGGAVSERMGVEVVVDRVERTLGVGIAAGLVGGWTVVGDDVSGATHAIRLPPGAAVPKVGERLSVVGRVGAPDPFWGWRVVEVEAG